MFYLKQATFLLGPITFTGVLFESDMLYVKEKDTTYRRVFFLAAGEGFEPSQTESESVVLPLHNPAICFS